jgi:hypothetical protein
MPLETADERKPSIGTLLTGIVSDMRALIVQELKLAKLEIGEDLQKMKAAAVALAIGGAVASLGGLFLLLMLVHLLEALTDLPLWACYGIIAALLLIVGLGLLMAGKKRAERVGIVPAETTEAIKEDVGWIKAHMKSNGSESRPAPH